MKKLSKVGLVLGLVVVLALVVYAETTKKKVDPPKVPENKVDPYRIGMVCPDKYDLAASITDISTGSDAAGPFVRVSGIVKNIGGLDFASTQTEARLFVIMSDRAIGSRIETVAITRLNKGQSINVNGTFHIPVSIHGNWCGWGCVPLDGGICLFLNPQLIINFGNASERDADCKASNNISPDRPEHHIHFKVGCSE